MKKTFEVKGVDLTNLYGVGDKNILFLESQLPLKLNMANNSFLVCMSPIPVLMFILSRPSV